MLHLQIFYYGREHCRARHHDLARCEICARFAGPLVQEAARQETTGSRGGPVKAPSQPSTQIGKVVKKAVKAAKAAKVGKVVKTVKAAKALAKGTRNRTKA